MCMESCGKKQVIKGKKMIKPGAKEWFKCS